MFFIIFFLSLRIGGIFFQFFLGVFGRFGGRKWGGGLGGRGLSIFLKRF